MATFWYSLLNMIGKTAESRKAFAFLLIFVLGLVNRIFDLGLDFEAQLELAAPLLAWAGLEGLIDVARALRGTGAGRILSPAGQASMIWAIKKAQADASSVDPSAPMGPDIFEQARKALDERMRKANPGGPVPPVGI